MTLNKPRSVISYRRSYFPICTITSKYLSISVKYPIRSSKHDEHNDIQSPLRILNITASFVVRAHNLSPRNPNNSIAIRPVSRRDTHSIPATHYTGENTCAICIHTSNYRAPVRPRTKPCSLLFCSCLSSTISHLQGILSGCMGIREERDRERENTER